MMRGLLRAVVTRMYFPEDPWVEDPVLQLVSPERRQTLIAKAAADRPAVYFWNIEMQGARETVFFEY